MKPLRTPYLVVTIRGDERLSPADPDADEGVHDKQQPMIKRIAMKDFNGMLFCRCSSLLLLFLFMAMMAFVISSWFCH